MPIHHQEKQIIPYPLSPCFSGIQEDFNLCWIEEILRPMGIGDDTLNITRVGDVECWCSFH